ncbi:MAG TPA: rRNA maturation RNase YbeY [Chitinophagaceae bacterium]|nr:rRNA maturation RNase YbeY [Chitinophagaceae bacterium]
MLAASRINFFFSGSKPTLRDRLKLKRFIHYILKREKKQLESINIVFSNDAEVHKINKAYLNHDYLTDIVTFELSAKGKPIIAELYISCDRVRENAQLHNTSFGYELHRVIFHGVLHLCGYNDKTKRQSRVMRHQEDVYLEQYLGKCFT